MTPAQAYGHPEFTSDVPVQGPTDQGLRTADCRQVQNRVPQNPACCGGPIPMWAQRSLSPVRGNYSGAVAGMSFGGVGVSGFALSAPGDPGIWSTLSDAQQAWVFSTLATLNAKIVAATGSMCPSWSAPSSASGTTNAVGCFQAWFNNAFAGQPVAKLRADGTFDQSTLDALITTTQIHAADFPTPFPSGPAAMTDVTKKPLSTGAMVGIGVAGAAVLGGIAYAVTHKKGRSRR
jgi:hypothetical protein